MTKPYDIPKALIWEAFKCVKANGGAAGVDRESIEQFESRLGDNLYKLWNRLCSGSYFPPPVKGVPIPKKSGGVRVLGVPMLCSYCTSYRRFRDGQGHFIASFEK